MRVAYVASAPFISGAERSLQTLLRDVIARQVEPIVIGPASSRLAPWCRDQGIPFRQAPLAIRDKWHVFRWWASVYAIRSILKRERVEIVHSNQLWSYQAPAAAAALLGLPRVCHFRDEASPEAVRWFCSRGIEAVICISQHIEQMVAPTWTDRGRSPVVRTLLNSVSLPDWPLAGGDPDSCRQARRQFGVPEGAFLVGFIGQIVPIKGLTILLEALVGLNSRRPWHLLVAGRDPHPGRPHELECRRRVAELGLGRSVTFLGFLEDPGPFYRAIDLVVVPSLEEPLGRIPLEAAAYGRPSLAHAVGGLPETILEGETGWLIEPGGPGNLRTALEATLDRPLHPMGPTARRWAEEAVNPSRYADEIVSLYRHILGVPEMDRSPLDPVPFSPAASHA